MRNPIYPISGLERRCKDPAYWVHEQGSTVVISGLLTNVASLTVANISYFACPIITFLKAGRLPPPAAPNPIDQKTAGHCKIQDDTEDVKTFLLLDHWLKSDDLANQ